MFTYKEKDYELKFSLKQIELVENHCKKSLVADIVATNGALPISTIKVFFGFCLKDLSNDKFVAQKEGAEIAEEMIKTEGYLKVNNMIIQKMSEDVPFLFQGA